MENQENSSQDVATEPSNNIQTEAQIHKSESGDLVTIVITSPKGLNDKQIANLLNQLSANVAAHAERAEEPKAE